MKPIPGSAVVLSIVSLTCAAAASVTTLAWADAFPEPSPAPTFNGPLAEARGWSLVTLGIVLPLAALSLAAARRGSLRARLLWLGTLAYLVYTYLEFAVSPPFTALYLPYIAAFGCAIPALVMAVASIDTKELATTFSDRTPRRTVALFALASAVLLTLAWLKEIVTQTVDRDFGWPHGEAAIGHVVHALDLGLQVPLGIATGLLLLRRRAAGYLAAAVMLVNSVCMGAALTAMVAAAALISDRSLMEAVPFLVLPLVAVALAVPFFRAIRPGADEHRPQSAGSLRAPPGVA
jgi:hypothetical protein